MRNNSILEQNCSQTVLLCIVDCLDLNLTVETSCIDEHVSSLPHSTGSRHCNVLINADIFVAPDANASIQVTVMLNAPQHEIYLHADDGAVKKQLNDKIEF